MARSTTARIHPTAILSPEVEVGEHVEIGPFAVLEGKIKLGDHCVIRPGAYVFGTVVMGTGNAVHTGAVIGDRPQHLKFAGEDTRVEIGDDNIFREHVTIHRGTTHSWKTSIGDRNFFMASSHVAHDCVIGNNCILANSAVIGGHCVLEDNVFISGNSAVHQFVRIGRLALLSGCSGTSKDMPPFIIQQNINNVCGVNLIGMRRNGFSPIQINAVREAYRILFLEALLLPVAVERLERYLGHIDVVQEMVGFLRKCQKGINHVRERNRQSTEEAAA